MNIDQKTQRRPIDVRGEDRAESLSVVFPAEGVAESAAHRKHNIAVKRYRQSHFG